MVAIVARLVPITPLGLDLGGVGVSARDWQSERLEGVGPTHHHQGEQHRQKAGEPPC